MRIYVKLDESDIVVSVQEVNDEIFGGDLIEINSYDPTLLFKRYNRESKEFEEVPPTTEPAKTPTIEELMEQVAELRDIQLISLDAQAEIAELSHENTLITFQAIADIFEAISGGVE